MKQKIGFKSEASTTEVCETDLLSISLIKLAISEFFMLVLATHVSALFMSCYNIGKKKQWQPKLHLPPFQAWASFNLALYFITVMVSPFFIVVSFVLSFMSFLLTARIAKRYYKMPEKTYDS